MAVTPLYTCVCGIQKKTSNHWVLAKVTDCDIRFMPWDSKLAQQDDVIVLCGEGCAAALLSRAMGTWKISPRKIPPQGTVTETVTGKAPELAVA